MGNFRVSVSPIMSSLMDQRKALVRPLRAIALSGKVKACRDEGLNERSRDYATEVASLTCRASNTAGKKKTVHA